MVKDTQERKTQVTQKSSFGRATHERLNEWVNKENPGLGPGAYHPNNDQSTTRPKDFRAAGKGPSTPTAPRHSSPMTPRSGSAMTTFGGASRWAAPNIASPGPAAYRTVCHDRSNRAPSSRAQRSASPKPRDDSLQRSRARSVTPRRERRMEEGSNSCRRRASPDRREVSQSRGVDKRAMHSGESHSRASQLASGGAGAQKRNLIRVKMKEAGTPGPGAYMQVDNWVKKSHNVRSASPKPGRPTTAAGTLRRSKHV